MFQSLKGINKSLNFKRLFATFNAFSDPFQSLRGINKSLNRPRSKPLIYKVFKVQLRKPIHNYK